LSKKENHISELQSISRILVPIDGSVNGNRALNFGIGLAKKYGSELIVLSVIPTPNILISSSAFNMNHSALDSYYHEQESAANHFIDEAIEVAKAEGFPKITSEVSRADKSIVEEIIQFASVEKVDLIVIGTRGLGGFRKLLQGSVSSGVVAHAHCNVLVVR
jgi:nucleotide-binding universal stress UspA family protein